MTTPAMNGTTYIPNGPCYLGDPPPQRVGTAIPNTHIFPGMQSLPIGQVPTAYLKPILDKLVALEERLARIEVALEQVLFLFPHTVIVHTPRPEPTPDEPADDDGAAIMRAIRQVAR